MTAHCKCPRHKGGPHRAPNGTKKRGRPQYKMQDSPTRYRIWQAIRVLRRFTMSQVAATSETKYTTAKRYLLDLTRVGYVREVAPSQPHLGREGEAIRVLARDSGPRPPRLRVDGTVFDPNVVSDSKAERIGVEGKSKRLRRGGDGNSVGGGLAK